ncbi:MAG: hypothetical protein NZ602_15750 [Thermoguttaceae bacterium]|nr:hypothetical protein [Thermoguttaceae bacterium]MDW8039345.1 hypothetical protein [Thermoguttaceae bacterium]
MIGTFLVASLLYHPEPGKTSPPVVERHGAGFGPGWVFRRQAEGQRGLDKVHELAERRG